MREDEYLLSLFDADSSRVKGYSTAEHEVVARVFLPLDDHGTSVRWSDWADLRGVALTATTRWSEIAPSVDLDIEPSMADGFVAARTITRFVEVLRGETTTPDEFFFALWLGYVEQIPPSAWQINLAASDDCYLTADSYQLVHDSLSWVNQCSTEKDVHFPAAFWPADQTFVAATWPYHDSLYLSCASQTLLKLQNAGFDALPVDREEILPSEGD